MGPARTTWSAWAAYRPVLAHRGLRRLLPAFGAADLGYGMSVVAVTWLALELAEPGQGAQLVGAAVAAYSLPGLAGALLFGRWLRRLPAHRLLVLSSLSRAVALGGVPVALAVDALHPAVYVALLSASSLLLAWSGAGKFTVLAEVVPSEHRLPANALVNSLRHSSLIFGPAIAGLLATMISPAWILGVVSLCEAALALQVHRARKALESPAGVAPVDTHESVSGLRLLRSRPELLGLLVLTWLFNFAYGPINVALPLYVRDNLHAQADVLGLHLTLLGGGALVGTLVAGMVLRKAPLWPIILVIIAGFGAALLPFSFYPVVFVTLACLAVAGLLWGPFGSISLTLFQDRTPPHMLSTILAARHATLLTATPLGAAAGGPLVAATEPRFAFAASGLVMIALAATATLILIGRMIRTRTR